MLLQQRNQTNSLVFGDPFCGEVCQREYDELQIQNVAVTAFFSITWMDLVEQTWKNG